MSDDPYHQFIHVQCTLRVPMMTCMQYGSSSLVEHLKSRRQRARQGGSSRGFTVTTANKIEKNYKNTLYRVQSTLSCPSVELLHVALTQSVISW